MIRSDRISALFFVGLSLFICEQSVVIGLGTPDTPGSGLLSFGAGAGIGILALWLLIQSFRSKKTHDEVQGGGTFRWGKFLLVCICLFGYALVVNWLGFVLTTFIVVFVLFHLLEPKKWWLGVIEAAAIATGNYLFFVEWLGLSLPRGFLGW
ncbi:MAG: tripartite tricarboxylate transporter TctB family protein [Deltaproteobacteria bacterium]